MTKALFLLLIPAVTFAAPSPSPEVTKLLVANLAALDTAGATDKLGFTKDATIAMFGGELPTDASPFELAHHSTDGAMKHKPGTPTIGVDEAAGFAWFQLPYDVSVEGPPPYREKERLGRLAVRTPTGWQLAGADYSELVSDAALYSDPNYIRDVPTDAPALSGDPAIAKTVAGWFKTGFGPQVAKRPNVIASGTAPGEYRVGDAATKLARAWDKLGLRADSVSVTTYAGGKAAIARVSVVMPHKKVGLAMDLFIVLVADGTSWKWVSMQFSV